MRYRHVAAYRTASTNDVPWQRFAGFAGNPCAVRGARQRSELPPGASMQPSSPPPASPASSYRHAMRAVHHYQGWFAGPTVSSLIVVSSGWSIAKATVLAMRSASMPYLSYSACICPRESWSPIVVSSSVLIAAG